MTATNHHALAVALRIAIVMRVPGGIGERAIHQPKNKADEQQNCKLPIYVPNHDVRRLSEVFDNIKSNLLNHTTPTNPKWRSCSSVIATARSPSFQNRGTRKSFWNWALGLYGHVIARIGGGRASGGKSRDQADVPRLVPNPLCFCGLILLLRAMTVHSVSRSRRKSSLSRTFFARALLGQDVVHLVREGDAASGQLRVIKLKQGPSFAVRRDDTSLKFTKDSQSIFRFGDNQRGNK